MRSILLTGLALLVVTAPPQAIAQSQLAVPWTVRKVAQSPPAAGRLILISGYLEKVGRDVVLRDNTSGQKIDLDFSGSAVPLEGVMQAEQSAPVEVTGRMTSSTNNGRRTVAVLGAVALKP